MNQAILQQQVLSNAVCTLLDRLKPCSIMLQTDSHHSLSQCNRSQSVNMSKAQHVFKVLIWTAAMLQGKHLQ